MKIDRIILGIGLITAVMGIIFHLQGQAMVGPKASFMYSNSDWTSYGIIIAAIGGIVSMVGIIQRYVRCS